MQSGDRPSDSVVSGIDHIAENRKISCTDGVIQEEIVNNFLRAI